tara:strand:+ start:3422 stop:4105 length:684 start_codon:yes stop_codon:yes gene_type:complete
MTNSENQTLSVTDFQSLVSTPFQGETNAICWPRVLLGDFSEIVGQVKMNGNITELGLEELRSFSLSNQGQLARDTLLNDFSLLEAHGANPVLNVIKSYDRDDFFFPTDVYSFHVDRSPIPVDTILCTYQGASSDILPNSQANQKILIPEIRDALYELYSGEEKDFESFLSEHFFDLHYQADPEAKLVNLGQGNVWRLAVDHPASNVLPCIHRAPEEIEEIPRLLMIC